MRQISPFLILGIFALILIMLLASPGYAQDATSGDLGRGAHLATIAGCKLCHSALEGPAFSGGIVGRNGQTTYAPNLTPALEGLGDWTDEAIRAAIATGVSPTGDQLHPVMPYLYYNGMADADLDALIAYLRSLEAVESERLPPNDLSAVTLPPVSPMQRGITVPDTADPIEYGRYLTDAVLACGSCHTPTLETGEPDPMRYLAGGDPFSGKWGTVYAANLTSHLYTGLGSWDDEDIILAFATGLQRDGRPIYAMPWKAYSALSGQEIEAVVAYLRSVPPVSNQVSPSDLLEGYDQRPPVGGAPPTPLGVALTILLVLIMGGLVVYVMIRQYRYAQQIRQTDWEDVFSTALSDARHEKSGQDKPSSEGPKEPPNSA